MFALTSLGFAASEVHLVVPSRDCSLFVPTSWFGEEGYLRLSTSTRLDLSLNGAGLRNSEFPLVRERNSFNVHRLPEVTILGHRRPPGEVTVFPTSSEGNVFGDIGALFFAGATLAFDPAGPHVAVARRGWTPPGETHSLAQVGIIGDSGLPVTKGVRFAEAPNVEFVTLFATATSHSYVSEALSDRLPRKALPRRGRSVLMLPSGPGVSVTLTTNESAPEYVVEVADEAVGLVLGVDVLRRFLTVFDFGASRVVLKHYPGAI